MSTTTPTQRSVFRGQRLAGLLAVSALSAVVIPSLTACEETSGRQILACPDPQLFEEAVSPYLQKRCGTLDCHGSESRPMRVYGQYGLRHPDELNIPGGEPISGLEIEANFLAACGLQPAEMGEAVTKLGASSDRLKLVAKPRGEMNHKGGRVVAEGDSGDRCITGWIAKVSEDDAERVRTECKAALDRLK